MIERDFRRLAEITHAVGASERFSKILSDGSLAPQAKIQLLNDITHGALGTTGPVVDAMHTAFGSSRPASQTLPQYLLSLTMEAGLAAASDDTGAVAGGRTAAVEQGLLDFAELIRANAALRFAMTDPGATDASKEAIIGSLLDGKYDPIAVTLLKTLVALNHGSDIDYQAVELAGIAAQRQGHVIADVRTAIDIDDDYKNKIADALTQAVGTRVEPRFVVDPSVVGSVVVRVGDEVWDGSVRRRLEQARVALTTGALTTGAQ